MGDAGATAVTQQAAESAGWHLAREVPAFPPDSTAGAVRAALEPFHGKVYQTSLDTEAEQALHRALDE